MTAREFILKIDNLLESTFPAGGAGGDWESPERKGAYWGIGAPESGAGGVLESGAVASVGD
jgi:hypothetical protein